MIERTRDEELRHRLRASDPLPPGEQLSAEAAARMRRAVLAEVPPARSWRLWRSWQPAAVAAMLVAGLGTTYLLKPWTTHEPKGIDVVASGPTDRPGTSGFSSAEPPDRQIQFITRGGTRVIWMLKPKTDSTATP